MAIKKQEFYEGAALHLIVRASGVSSIRYDSPFFVLNDEILVLLKYSTRGRSPWGFTFTTAEQASLRQRTGRFEIVIGLVCGADGVAALTYQAFSSVVVSREAAVHIACYRQHNEHYGIYGPDGTLDRKVAPSNWSRLLSS